MSNEKPIVEVYTSKLDMTVTSGTATLAIVVSATRGSVEDVNKAMQKAVDTLRVAFKKEE